MIRDVSITLSEMPLPAGTDALAESQSRPNRSAAARAPAPFTAPRRGARGALAKPDGRWGEAAGGEASGEGPDDAL